jgi:hypothetical protein
MRKKLEKAENKMQERQEASAKQANKLAQEKQQQDFALNERKEEREDRKVELENITNMRDNETKIFISQNSNEDNSEDGVVDPIAEEKLDLEREKATNQKLKDIKELESKMKMHNDKMKREDKKIAVARKNKATK